MNWISYWYSAMHNPIRCSMDTLWLLCLFLSTLVQLHLSILPMFHTRANVVNPKHYIQPIPLLHNSPQLPVRNLRTEFHDNSTDGLVADTRLQIDRQTETSRGGWTWAPLPFFFFLTSLRTLLIFPTECILCFLKHTLLSFVRILNYFLSNGANLCSLWCTKRISYSTHTA
jgi:hypothetical protein